MVCATGLADAALLVQQRDDGHDCVLSASPGARRTAPPREPVARTTRSWYRPVRRAPRAEPGRRLTPGPTSPQTLSVSAGRGDGQPEPARDPPPGGIPATGHTSPAGGAGEFRAG